MTVSTTMPSELVEDANEVEAEPLDTVAVAVIVPELAVLLVADMEELADVTALPSELDALVLETAAETDDAAEDPLAPVDDEPSEASFANPMAAGEYRYTL